MLKIRGRIIRIIDKKTVIINLGRQDGVRTSSLFSILGSPEPIEDPFSGEKLGEVSIVKGRVRASQVFDRFTIASTQWAEPRSTIDQAFFSTVVRWEEHHDELLVSSGDLRPWKARTEEPVEVGDVVEVSVSPPAGETAEATQENSQPNGEEPGAEQRPPDGESDSAR